MERPNEVTIEPTRDQWRRALERVGYPPGPVEAQAVRLAMREWKPPVARETEADHV